MHYKILLNYRPYDITQISRLLGLFIEQMYEIIIINMFIYNKLSSLKNLINFNKNYNNILL